MSDPVIFSPVCVDCAGGLVKPKRGCWPTRCKPCAAVRIEAMHRARTAAESLARVCQRCGGGGLAKGLRVCAGCRDAQAAPGIARRARAAEAAAARAAAKEAKAAALAAASTPEAIEAKRLRRLEQGRAWRKANPGRQRDLCTRWRKSGAPKALEQAAKLRLRTKARNAVTRAPLPANFIETLFKAQRGKCAYCRDRLVTKGPSKFHLDHIVPLKAGGGHVPSNLQLACPGCNIRKGARDPVEFAQSLGRIA